MSSIIKKYILFVAALIMLFALLPLSVQGSRSNVIYLRNGGNGDGSTYEQALGDFKEAVAELRSTGGTIVVCGEYSFNELIALSERSGTANGKKTITVTSVYAEHDYRQTDKASLCFGNQNGSANMSLAGDFVFENIKIVTAGSSKSRAVICNGNSVVFGEGIVCEKTHKAPYISIVGGCIDGDKNTDYSLTVKSGTYNYVCASNRNGIHKGDTSLVIDGGFFEGDVSVTGVEDENNIQQGDASLTINGGVFSGRVGTVNAISGKLDIAINGGELKKDVFCLAVKSVIDINGGDLQRVTQIKIEDIYSSLQTEKSDSSQGRDDVPFVFVVNQYNGDIAKLIEKIHGDNVLLNINTQGGVDDDPNEEIQQHTVQATAEAEPETADESVKDTEKADLENESKEKQYFLGSKNNTVLAVIVLTAVIFSSTVVFAYRTVHRKK